MRRRPQRSSDNGETFGHVPKLGSQSPAAKLPWGAEPSDYREHPALKGNKKLTREGDVLKKTGKRTGRAPPHICKHLFLYLRLTYSLSIPVEILLHFR
jgi:hypothetical protein